MSNGRSVENVRSVLDKAKEDIVKNPSEELIARWDTVLSLVCPKLSDLKGDEYQDMFDMMFEWNWFSIKIK